MTYRISYAPGVEKDLLKLPHKLLPRVDAAITQLSQNPGPLGCTKLIGSSRTYRVRVGNYRIIYDIIENGRVVVVLIVAHRKEVYRGF